MLNVPGEAIRPATLPDIRTTSPWARALAIAVYVALLVLVVAVRNLAVVRFGRPQRETRT